MIAQLLAIGLLIALLPLSYAWVSGDSDKYRKLVWITTFLVFDLILFGSFTRLTDSGLGCPDWPGCYGTSNPIHAGADIAAAEAAMPHGPVTEMKAWIEMLHRYFAMAVGALILTLTLLAWTRRRTLGHSPWAATGLLALVCVQGAFGAWTVTLKLMPLMVTLHLLLGMALLAALAWLAAERTAAPGRNDLAALRRLQSALLLGFGLLVAQIALGGWVSTNYAVLACQGFPQCNGSWLPEMNFADGLSLWRELGHTAGGELLDRQSLVAIHWLHRAFAVVVLAYLAWLALKLGRLPSLRKFSRALWALLVLQFSTGLSNIVLGWPLIAALAHNGGAALLVLTLVWLLYRSRREQGSWPMAA
ncbi:cytochrome c oxidase assembly protein subunit 15 [Sulfuritortus calidifontis]|uniref:Cytochrome c oxidase assembly protein subunit 15 n=1 Tax=Sulfuritortus calidifontis TaxID=1914471 RepID=A0A4R3JY63_9PROT|nr:COX15/CtaA family protein [Sulfuritortus calidifontis]TCS72217.1 cytochrome c oxidase assembly protein subunit 15 [Sulfuritortus calidifontis]